MSDAGFATCKCTSCQQKIEFNLDGYDPEGLNFISCPHCGEQTQLYVAHERAKPQRVALSKAERATPEGRELIDLLCELGGGGIGSPEQVKVLADWLSGKSETGIPAIRFLLEITTGKLSKGDFTRLDAFEVQVAIERVIPKDRRGPITAKRVEAWENMPAPETLLQYIRELGGSPDAGLTRKAASALAAELRNRATPKQVAFLTYLGVEGASELTKAQASERIQQLLQSESLSRKHEDWITDRIVLYPEIYKDDLAYMLEEELPELLHNYVRSRIVGASERLTKQRIKEVMANLSAENAVWWQDANKREVFFDRLAALFPRCVDGRALEKGDHIPKIPRPAVTTDSFQPSASPKRSGCLTLVLVIVGAIVLILKALAR